MKNNFFLFTILLQIFGQISAYDLQIEQHIKDLNFNALYKHIKIKNNPVQNSDLEKYLDVLKEKIKSVFLSPSNKNAINPLFFNNPKLLSVQEEKKLSITALLSGIFGWGTTVFAACELDEYVTGRGNRKDLVIGVQAIINGISLLTIFAKSWVAFADSTTTAVTLDNINSIELLLKESVQ